MPSLQVYRASAGSGKTYQLALKYITLLLGRYKNGRLDLFKGNDLRRHREILAITFTNKATQEMRRRIVKELALLADPDSQCDYRRDLHFMVNPDDTELNDTETDRKISLAAVRALDSMLFDFGGMQVSTIDAFFQRVLRSFAYEADLAGNYELMLENDRMTDMAINDMLAHACGMKGVIVPRGLNSGYLRQQVKSLIESQAINGNEYKVFSPDSKLRGDMIQFVKHLSDEDYLKKKEDIDKFLVRPNALANLVDAIKRRRTALLSELASRSVVVEQAEAYEKMSSNAKSFISKTATGDIEGLSAIYLEHILVAGNYLKCLNKNKFPPEITADFEQRMDELATTLRNILSFDAIIANTRFLGLFRDILVVRNDLKAHLNTILLSDTNELLHKIIDDSDTPFIYERIGRQLHHFLIDEFQDTSRMQWRNLLPLLTDSLGSGNDSLIIGDVKQCIYRFRNSSPELLANDIDRTPQISSYVEHCSLEDNWRSAPAIVDFNNRLFELVGCTAPVAVPKADAYKSVRQNARRTEIEGYVDIDVVLKSEMERAYGRMIENINRELSSGYTPGDIVVLVRTNNDAHTCVEVLLEAERDGRLPAGTMVVSDEALYVSSAQSVKWIVSRLHELNGMTTRNSPRLNNRGLRTATAEDIDWLQEHLLESKAATKGAPALEQVIADFNAHRADGNQSGAKRLIDSPGQTLTELVEQLIRTLPDQSLARGEVQYLCAFQDLVLDYCRRKSPTLQGFLKLWDEELSVKAAVGLAEGVNAIRVMTIHKSKGLEFNCVHIPLVKKYLDEDANSHWYDVYDFLNSQNLGVEIPRYFPLTPGGRSSSLKYTVFAPLLRQLKDDQTIDEINTLYVAFTRACQELIVSIIDLRGETDRKKNAPMPSNHPSGLLCPLLAQMTGNEDAPWTFGEPTRKYVKSTRSDAESEQLGSHLIEAYVTRRRPEMWSRTKAASVSDSGEKI